MKKPFLLCVLISIVCVSFAEEYTFYPPYTDPHTTVAQYQNNEYSKGSKGDHYALTDSTGNLNTGLMQHNVVCSSNSYILEAYVNKCVNDIMSRNFTVPYDGQWEITFTGTISAHYYEVASALLGAGKGKLRFWLNGGHNLEVRAQQILYETDLSFSAFLEEASLSALWATAGAVSGGATDLVQFFDDISGFVVPEASWPPNPATFSMTYETSLLANTDYHWNFWLNSDLTSHAVLFLSLQYSALESDITLDSVNIKYLGEIPPNQPPVLYAQGFIADPAGPDLYPHTELEFYVRYDDPENFSPQAIAVRIDGVLYPMRQDAGDRYKLDTGIEGIGQHFYSFYAVDKQGEIVETSMQSLTIEEFDLGSFEVLDPSDYIIDDSVDVYASNNNDGIIQSGEIVSIRPQIKYADDASGTATRIDVTLTSDSSFVEEVYSPENYPDMAPGETSYPETGEYFKVEIDSGCSGGFYLDMDIEWEGQDGEAKEAHIEDAFLLDIKPVAWVNIVPDEYDFGAVRPLPENDISFPLAIQNTGTEILHVTDIQTSHADTEVAPKIISIEPGQSSDVDVTVHVSGLDGAITRDVYVISDGRARKQTDEHLVISGLVSDTPLSFQIPGTRGQLSDPDIGGSWIVWEEDELDDGDWNICAYNVATGERNQITSLQGMQRRARISDNIIVWNDARTWDGSGSYNDHYDIYGYDLTTKQEFLISDDSASESVVGVSDNLIAFRRLYEIVDGYKAYNLLVFEYVGGGQCIQRYTTGFSPKSGTETRPGLRNDADFGDGMLAYEQRDIIWDGEDWTTGNYKIYKIDFANGEGSPSVAVDENTFGIASALHKFVYWGWHPVTGCSTIFEWPGNTPIMPDPDTDYGDDWDTLAFNGTYVSYDKWPDSGKLYYFDGIDERILTTIPVDQTYSRADGNGIVWQQQDAVGSSYVYVAYLDQADVSVSGSNISFSNSNPMEGTAIDVTVLAQNATDHDLIHDITVKLFDGDPDIAGIQIGTDYIISGGILSQNEELATFTSIPVGLEGTHDIFAKLEVDGFDVYASNKASKTLIVADAHTAPPTITNVWVSEYNGDGDGLVESDENVMIQWQTIPISPLSIANTYCQIADVNYVGEGSYHVILDPFAEGDYPFTIYAEDNDLSPESVSYEGNFSVAIASIEGDINNDGIVDIRDAAKVALQWSNDNCSNGTRWCRGADLDQSTNVNSGDLSIISANWLEELFLPFFNETLDIDPGWIVEGEWLFGQPAGLGGGLITGNPDPTSGYTGNNVYGVNLNGDYTTLASGPYNLTTVSIDGSGYHNIHMKFARWLNSDYAPYVTNKVEVSNDNATWHTIWQSSSTSSMEDSNWQIVEYDISGYADNQDTIYIRWSYEVTDSSAFPYSGWNIDDVQLWGSPN